MTGATTTDPGIRPDDLPGPDVIDLLVSQHARAEELFQEILNSAGDDRRDAFHELVHLLSVHETAEEEVIHPLSRASIRGGPDVVDARLEEERKAKELLSELYDRGSTDPEFVPMLLRFRTAVLAHATYEERYEFPELRRANPRAALMALVPVVRAAEATAPTRPHPGTETATRNLLLGPMAAVADRARDAVRDMVQRGEKIRAEKD